MAEIPYTDIIGDHTVALTAAQLESVRAYSKGLGYTPIADALKTPAGVFPVHLVLGTDPDASNKSTSPWRVPFPCRIVAVDMAIESTASAGACVGDILVDPLGGGAPVTILNAAEDLKTGAPDYARVAPEVGLGTLAYTDEVIFKVTSTGAGSVKGANAILWIQRL